MAIKTFEEAVKLTDAKEREAEIMARLDDYEGSDLLDVFYQANSWDGSFDWCLAFDAEDIGDYVDTSDAYRMLCSIVFGKVDNVNDMLRYDAYGNLESVSKWDLEKEAFDCTDELASWLMDDYEHIDSLYEEDDGLLNAWRELDVLDTEEEKAEYLMENFDIE